MKRGRIPGLGLCAVAVTLVAAFSSCHLFQTAQVQFGNQSSDTFSSITFGAVSVGTLTPGSTSSWNTIDSGTYTLNSVSGAGAITWPQAVKVDSGQQYTVVFLGSATNLEVQITQQITQH